MNDYFIADLEITLPTVLDWLSVSKQALLFAGGLLLLALLFRAILGKFSDLNRSLSSAIGILLLFAGTVAAYVYCDVSVRELLPPLPFVQLFDDQLILIDLQSQDLNMICYQLLSCIILAFFVNLLDSLLPQGESVIGWYFLRLLSLVLALVCYAAVNWIETTLIPVDVLTYAPMILLGVLVFMLLLGLFKLILGVALTMTNPIIGAIYAFFFSHRIGKQVSKAVLTTVILAAAVFLLGQYSYLAFSIARDAMSAYIPVPAVMLAIWYLVGHIL